MNRDDLLARRSEVEGCAASTGPEQAGLQFHLLPRRGLSRCAMRSDGTLWGPVEALLPQALSTVFKAMGLGRRGPSCESLPLTRLGIYIYIYIYIFFFQSWIRAL